MNIGDKIRNLRKERGLTQEMIAEHFNLSAQAISKWETNLAYPDITLVPSIASFFNISVNELFDFDTTEIEAEVMKIVDNNSKFRDNAPEKAEGILREGLKKYPNNEILLNNLLYVLHGDKTNEKIEIAKKLIQYTKDDEIKYDAIRILAGTYFDLGNDTMGEYFLEQIPEIYFSKLELDALYLKGDDKKRATNLQLFLSIEQSIEMISCLIEIANKSNDKKQADIEFNRGLKIIESFNPVDEKYKNAYNHLKENFIKNNSLKRF
ncbi:helix-turn-helix transcriptional regulator [Sedimentibacter sp. zth1]|uniref:helix-turn-helix domain-containing protein n=1 Tax=Sedimentibacter sp. zth1 TaxID=2816908 RepID=UPI001A915DBC|nr:helix-turn-helix transcriptional regulator [Sedimentibacter sp. zth1]QSX04856.1 helix-turn-helix transcriptional regulator [Sedimentibacter sp. zth1]